VRLLFRGSHDEGERACDGTRVSAGDRAVEGMLVLHLGGIVNVTCELRGGGGEVDQVRPAPGGADEAVLGEVDILDVRGVADHGEDDIGVLGRLCGAVGPVRATSEKVLGL